MKIAIDAGHGSNTPGKRTPPLKTGEQYREHYANVGVCVRLDNALRRCGFETLKVSWDDADGKNDANMPLAARQAMIRAAGCRICVSIHFNAYGDGTTFNSASGVCTYIHSNRASVGESRELAHIVQRYLIEGTAQKNRGVKESGFAMCNCTVMNVKASILCELAFMTNEYEAGLTTSSEFWDECAEEITKGICEYTGAEYVEYEASDDTPEGEDKHMKTVTGATANEKMMIKAIQKAAGAIVDGAIGTQTMSDIACAINADCFPLTLSIYGMPVIVAKDINVIASPKKGLKAYKNSMSGSFYAGGRPCSICISDGKVEQENACHAYQGYPESVIYKAGRITSIKRVKNVSELPKDTKWAVGGMGLLDYYAPEKEGFCKVHTGEDFSDVLRDTNHTVLGFKNGYLYLVYCKSMTAAQVNAFAKKLGLSYAVMLDGGHIAGINGGEAFARINTSITQYYVLQGI